MTAPANPATCTCRPNISLLGLVRWGLQRPCSSRMLPCVCCCRVNWRAHRLHVWENLGHGREVTFSMAETALKNLRMLLVLQLRDKKLRTAKIDASHLLTPMPFINFSLRTCKVSLSFLSMIVICKLNFEAFYQAAVTRRRGAI